jgi:hypothetical protein
MKCWINSDCVPGTWREANANTVGNHTVCFECPKTRSKRPRVTLCLSSYEVIIGGEMIIFTGYAKSDDDLYSLVSVHVSQIKPL